MKHEWNTEGTYTFCNRCSIFADDLEKGEPCSGSPWYPVLKRLIADGEIEDPRELWKELHPGEAD